MYLPEEKHTELKQLLAFCKAEARRKNDEIEYKRWARMERLKAQSTFTITISRMKNSVEVAAGLEKFDVEGYEWAKKVYDAYANNATGYMLKLHRVRMKAGEETVHSMVFNGH